MENRLNNIEEQLVEFGFVLCDLHPMVILSVTPHSLEWKLFSTQFTGSLATVNHVVAKLVFLKVF